MSYKGVRSEFHMLSKGNLSESAFLKGLKKVAIQIWALLSENQKNLAKKAWGVMTYKWKWQIALNIPYLAIFILDRSIPAVHEFDMNLVSSITSQIPIPAFISSIMKFT